MIVKMGTAQPRSDRPGSYTLTPYDQDRSSEASHRASHRAKKAVRTSRASNRHAIKLLGSQTLGSEASKLPENCLPVSLPYWGPCVANPELDPTLMGRRLNNKNLGSALCNNNNNDTC
jgi:hypothetical protein